MDVRQLSHEMQDSHFGLKDVQFDAIVTSINGDGIMLSSMDGQVTTAGRVQRRIRSAVDTLRTGDKVHAAGHIENTGEHGWVKNQLVIESIVKIDG